MNTTKKLLRRSPQSPLGGVASGIANYLQVEQIWIQLAFGITLIFYGTGFFLYLACWLLIPATTSSQTASIALTTDTKKVLAAIVLLTVGGALFSDSFGRDLSFFGATALIAIGSVLLFRSTHQKITPPAQVLESMAQEPSSSKDIVKAAPSAPSATDTEMNEHWATPQTTLQETSVAIKYPPITAATLTLTILFVGVALLLKNIGIPIGMLGVVGIAAICIGTGILVAALWAKPAKLILVAVLLLPAFAAAPFLEAIYEDGAGHRPITISSEEELEEVYALGVGELDLDLDNLTLTQDRTIAVSSEAGIININLPKNMPVEVHAEALFGELQIFTTTRSGIKNDLTLTNLEDKNEPTLHKHAKTTYGLIEIHRSNDHQQKKPEGLPNKNNGFSPLGQKIRPRHFQ